VYDNENPDESEKIHGNSPGLAKAVIRPGRTSRIRGFDSGTEYAVKLKAIVYILAAKIL
jgi:hypothetical protein